MSNKTDHRQVWASYALMAMLAALACLALFYDLSGGSLFNSDDPIYASIARDMYRSGNMLDLTYQGQLIFEKPPFLFWCISLFYSILGVNDLSARLPDVLSALGVLGAVFLLARRDNQSGPLRRALPGLFAAAFLLSSFLFYFNARRVMTDMPFLLFVLLFFYFLSSARTAVNLSLAGLFGGLSMLTKGTAFAVPLFAAAIWVFASGAWRQWRFKDWLWFLGPLAVVGGSWHLYEVGVHGGEFLGTYLGYHAVSRLSSSLVGDTGPGYYVSLMLDLEGPVYTLLVASGVTLAFLSAALEKRKTDLLLAIFLALYLVLIVLMKTRLDHYILPVLVVAAIYVGRGLCLAADAVVGWSGKPWLRLVTVGVGAWAIFWMFQQHNHQAMVSADFSPATRELASGIAEYEGPLVVFNVYNPTIGWYADKPVQVWSLNPVQCEVLSSIDMLRRADFVWCPTPLEIGPRLREIRPALLTTDQNQAALLSYLPGGFQGVYRERRAYNEVALIPIVENP